MSEELYNSNDFCKLAEEFEELKKENAELSKDKDRLMNLFMESSEYVFDTSANMKIESLTRKCKALEADYAVSNREMLLMQVEIGELKSELARRDEIITRLKEDGERLAGKLISMYADEMYECSYCGHGVSKSPDEIDHTPDCPITLHRALMKELE
jgi:rubrerythrin